MRPNDHSPVGRFRVSSYSGGVNCIEVGTFPDGTAVVRDTKDAERRTHVAYTRPAWATFVRELKLGDPQH